MVPKVSVIVTAYNSAPYIKRCLNAIFQQTYASFELIVVNDGSIDNTLPLLQQFNDHRLKIIDNHKNLGIAKSRNIGCAAARGKYIFFTDSDCIPVTDWLNQGLKKIGGHDIVTGWTLYEDASPSFSDRVVQGKDVFFTCNLGFKKSSIEAVGGFDEKNCLRYGEDKELCLKVLQHGGTKIYSENMMVIHQKRLRTPPGELRDYSHYFKSKLYRQIAYQQEADIFLRIIRPDMLAFAIFPLLLFVTKPIKTVRDLKILPFTWMGLILGRLRLWKEGIKLRKFYL